MEGNYGWILIAMVVGAAVLFFDRGRSSLQRRRQMTDPRYRPNINEAYEALRSTAIGRRLSSLGLAAKGDRPKPFSLVVDWEHASLIATLATLVTGDVEIYFSDGGGSLGGITDPAIRAASVTSVQRAAAAAGAMARATKFPLPLPGSVAFHLLMSDGAVLTAEVPRTALESGESELAPAWSATQRIFQQLTAPG